MKDFISLGVLIFIVLLIAVAYIKKRGPEYGPKETYILLIPTILVNSLFYLGLKTITPGETSAYSNLLIMLFLLATVPIALVVNINFVIALCFGIARSNTIRIGVLASSIIGLIMLSQYDSKSLPESNSIQQKEIVPNDKLSGESWALENNPKSIEECRKQSSGRAFLEGCKKYLP